LITKAIGGWGGGRRCRPGRLGWGWASASCQRALAATYSAPRAKSVNFVFLTGGLAHHDSFDPKPKAPSYIRREFQPRATKVPGIQLCEHLPLLADLADRFALARSMRTSHV